MAGGGQPPELRFEIEVFSTLLKGPSRNSTKIPSLVFHGISPSLLLLNCSGVGGVHLPTTKSRAPPPPPPPHSRPRVRTVVVGSPPPPPLLSLVNFPQGCPSTPPLPSLAHADPFPKWDFDFGAERTYQVYRSGIEVVVAISEATRGGLIV